MSDELIIWIGAAAAILLMLMEPRLLKIVLFIVIFATIVCTAGIFGIIFISAISSLLGRWGKK